MSRESALTLNCDGNRRLSLSCLSALSFGELQVSRGRVKITIVLYVNHEALSAIHPHSLTRSVPLYLAHTISIIISR